MSTTSRHAIPHGVITRAFRNRWTMAAVVNMLVDRCLLVPIGAAIAVLWANLWSESYFTVSHQLAFAVNNVTMAIFFGFVTQELVEEVMPGGALHTWRRSTVPLLAAAGGAVVSTAAYLIYATVKHETVVIPGWPVATAIDVAFAYFVVRNIFRRIRRSRFSC